MSRDEESKEFTSGGMVRRKVTIVLDDENGVPDPEESKEERLTPPMQDSMRGRSATHASTRSLTRSLSNIFNQARE